jgi:hypothetical protein
MRTLASTMKAFVLAAFLVRYFAYQVAYGTNESSYQHGYRTAIAIYECGVIQTSDCDTPTSDDVNTVCVNTSNSTACMDGYLNGWSHWCSTDSKDCATLAQPRPS